MAHNYLLLTREGSPNQLGKAPHFTLPLHNHLLLTWPKPTPERLPHFTLPDGLPIIIPLHLLLLTGEHGVEFCLLEEGVSCLCLVHHEVMARGFCGGSSRHGDTAGVYLHFLITLLLDFGFSGEGRENGNEAQMKFQLLSLTAQFAMVTMQLLSFLLYNSAGKPSGQEEPVQSTGYWNCAWKLQEKSTETSYQSLASSCRVYQIPFFLIKTNQIPNYSLGNYYGKLWYTTQ